MLVVADKNAQTGKKPVIVCFGLAFKPDIDDLRKSPALEVAKVLSDQGYEVAAVEPNIIRITSLTSHLRLTLIGIIQFVLFVKHKEFATKELLKKFESNNTLDFLVIKFVV